MCAGIELEAESVVVEIPREITIEKEIPEPVAIYVVLDNSRSMEQTSNGTHTTWEQAKIALTDFATDPASEYIDVGIQFFHPLPPPELLAEHQRKLAEAQATLTPDQWDDYEKEFHYRVQECDGLAHAEPAVLGRLPAVTDAFVGALNSTSPEGGTPTVGALMGGVNFCTNFQKQHPDEQCVVVFITDGQPNGCGLSLGCSPGFTPDHKGQCVDPDALGMLTPIVQTGARAGVKTYTVGMEGVSADGFDLLDALAVAGGTDCTPGTPGKGSCDTSETGGAGLLEKLNLIRDTVVVTEKRTFVETIVETSPVPCNWEIPPPPLGQVLDPRLVNVKLGRPGQQSNLPNVPAVTDCTGIHGWYYDNPAAPNSIHVCPQTCAAVEADPAITANVVFGCATTTVPR